MQKFINAINFLYRITRVNSNTMDDNVEQYEAVFCKRGYHVYKVVWRAAAGKDLGCERETSNAHDRYAVAVMKKGCVISILIKRSNGTSRFVKTTAEVQDDNRRSLRRVCLLMVRMDPTRSKFHTEYSSATLTI